MRRGKRALDLTLAGGGLVVLSPVLLAIALAVKLSDGGSVLFRQERVGLRGRRFRMMKFRTMVPDADRRGGQLTVGEDERITRVGRFLRRAKLDELPQLLNVLAGDMSLVGPRPEVPRYVDLYTPSQRRVLELVPGITDPASLEYSDESALLGSAADPEALYVQRIMPEKIRLNVEYAACATHWSDLVLLTRTVLAVLRVLARRRPGGGVLTPDRRVS